jgi:hypothetical protein
MMKVLLLLVCLGAVFAQMFPQQNLYPVTQDGFDVVMLDDMSFVTEIHYQTFMPGNPPNFSMYIFGGAVARSIFPGSPEHSFYVGSSPSDYWFMPFLDVHAFLDANNNTWFLGPVQPLGVNHIGNALSGYELEIAAISNIGGQNIRFYMSPVGLDGTFFSVFPLSFPGSNEAVIYLAGFWLGGATNQTLQFGVYRAHFNITSYNLNPDFNNTNVVTFNPAVDAATVVNISMFTAYNEFFKPFIFHMWNTTYGPTPNTTYTYIVDPASNTIFTVTGNVNPTIPLVYNRSQNFRHAHGYFSSAQIYYAANYLIIGVGTWGMGTGSIIIFNLATFQVQYTINLPTNYSDPKALVVDEFEGALYVGMNGGGAVLRYDLTMPNFNLTGSQNLPFYLHRVWAGLPTFEHVYFVTNEQHSKVFRVAKADFCLNQCNQYQFCKAGNCECNNPMVMKDGTCQWPEVIKETNIAKRNKAGETALGILFMFSFIAAAAGWYMWYRTRRSSYQAV